MSQIYIDKLQECYFLKVKQFFDSMQYKLIIGDPKTVGKRQIAAPLVELYALKANY